MIAADVAEFIESGCGLLVGSVGRDGRPHAGRGWGAVVLDAAVGRVRVIIDADDVMLREGLEIGHVVAVTGADIGTLRGVQCKGPVETVEEGTHTDRVRVRRYCDGLFSAITELDGTPREKLQRLVPDDVATLTFRVEEIYDQTPGPGAGAAYRATR